MEPTYPKPRWAPRVQPQKIRRLYESNARGLLDEDLIMDVGIGLYLRCQSLLRASEAQHGRVPCPVCDAILLREGTDRDAPTALLHCEDCGWKMTWGGYQATFRHQELGVGGAGPFFAEYIQKWEQSETPQERWLLIDRLIHRWHWENRQDEHILGRPAGVNLIEGNRQQVLAFLDSLSNGGSAETKQAWR